MSAKAKHTPTAGLDKSVSHIQLFATPWTIACQAPLSMGFSRQRYWSGLPCLPPGYLPDPGIELMSPVSPALQMDSLQPSHRGNTVLNETEEWEI